MASSTIKVVIDVVKDKAAAGLSSFKTDLANTEGAFGKLKVAGSGAMDYLKVHAAEFAVAAGAALVGFAAKAVTEFQGLALEAGKFKDATGLAVEDASRWIEVGGDLGIGAGEIEGAILRMDKAIGSGKLKEFEADVVRAKDGTVDANATFQNLVTTIGAIKDPTERALAAQEAFGRGYAGIAELMELSAGDLKAALDGVSDSKVIDDTELGKARDMRAAMDDLKDKFEDVSLKIGEVLVPALAGVVGGISGIIEKAEQIDDFGEKLGGGSGLAGKARGLVDQFVPLDNLMSGLSRTFDGDSSSGERLMGVVEVLTGGVPILGEAVSELNDDELDLTATADALAERLQAHKQPYLDYQAGMKGAGEGAWSFEDALADAEAQAEKTKEALEDLKTAGVDKLNEALRKRDAVDEFVRAQNDVIWYTAAAKAANDNEKLSLEEKQEAQRLADEAVRGSIDATIAYIETLGGIPPAIATNIAALIDGGNYAEAERQLAQLVAEREARVRVRVISPGGGGFYDSGGHIPAGRSGIVAEKRPEFVNGVLVAGPANVTGGARTAEILGNGHRGNGMGLTINNYSTPMSAADVAFAIRLNELMAPGSKVTRS